MSPGTTGTPVTGAVPGANNSNQPWFVLGDGTQYHTQQDHLKLKLAYDINPTLRANYLLGVWKNVAAGNSASYLQDGERAAGLQRADQHRRARLHRQPGAQRRRLRADARATAAHHARPVAQEPNPWRVGLGGRGQPATTTAATTSARTAPRTPSPGAQTGGAGTIADGGGTGWNTLALKGIWRPPAAGGAHVVDFGLQQDSYQLRYQTSSIPGNYLVDGPAALASSVRGDTSLRSLYAQDVWQLAEAWKAVLGGRAERWQASDGRTDFSGASSLTYPTRRETFFSPKAALSWQSLPDTVLKASLGRAVRMPTVAELYGATSTTNSQYINDPNLAPEKSWTTELSAEQDLGFGSARADLLRRETRATRCTRRPRWTRRPTATSAGCRTSAASRPPGSSWR